MDEHAQVEAEISILPPLELSSVRTGEDYLLSSRVTFNGRTYQMQEFLAACLPYLNEIGDAADSIRAMKQIEGHDFATVTLRKLD